jgi:hypothetical protein
MNFNLEKAIVKTLCYADVFDYPLTRREIFKRLIYPGKSVKQKQIDCCLKRINIIRNIDGYFYLAGRKDIINIRLERQYEAGKKIIIAKKIAKLLKRLPFIKLIGISGGLAVENTDAKDDIDIIIITETDTVWIVRFISVLILNMFGVRRKPNDVLVRNKICLNMFLDDNHLEIKTSSRDLYTAHEIAQMVPLINRSLTYEKFITSNLWILEFLPNILTNSSFLTVINNNNLRRKPNNDQDSKKGSFVLYLIEDILKKLQYMYMKKRITDEVISDGVLKFHSNKVRNKINNEYTRRLMKYIPNK